MRLQPILLHVRVRIERPRHKAMVKPPSNRRKRRESSSSDGASASAGSSAAAIKADPEENEQAATNGKNTTSAAGLIFKEEVLNRRVQVLFDVDTGKDDEPMAHQWYEGTITAVQLEPANAKAGAGGGKRGGKRGARSSKSAGNGSTKLKATHRVEFDDGDVRWFDLVYWTGKGELKWVGEEPTPVSHPTIDPNPNAGNAVGTEEATAATSPQEAMDAAAAASAAPLHVQKDGAVEKASPLVSPNGKRNAPENSVSGSIGGSGEPQASAKKAKVSPPPPESLPHTLIHGKKYYIV